ncbi:MAG: type II toxin-antitoxin system VapC family toxin [Actinobacteria bacterium]|nr:type II toxin-antitoxin system VapC family toxin [Actinomycetota bacterium]
MPSSADPPDALVDTSVAVALVVEDHAHHAAVVGALDGLVLGLAGHAAFETFSVLTRLPAPARRPPAVVREILSANYPATRHLSADGAAALHDRLAELGIAGGSVFDALVGAVAVEHDVALLTRDRRALETYRALGVQVRIVAD